MLENVHYLRERKHKHFRILPVKAGVTFANVPDFQRGWTELGVEGNPILAEEILIDPVQYLDRALARSCNKVITLK